MGGSEEFLKVRSMGTQLPATALFEYSIQQIAVIPYICFWQRAVGGHHTQKTDKQAGAGHQTGSDRSALFS